MFSDGQTNVGDEKRRGWKSVVIDELVEKVNEEIWGVQEWFFLFRDKSEKNFNINDRDRDIQRL